MGDACTAMRPCCLESFLLVFVYLHSFSPFSGICRRYSFLPFLLLQTPFFFNLLSTPPPWSNTKMFYAKQFANAMVRVRTGAQWRLESQCKDFSLLPLHSLWFLSASFSIFCLCRWDPRKNPLSYTVGLRAKDKIIILFEGFILWHWAKCCWAPKE